jgi:hypothetical protein
LSLREEVLADKPNARRKALISQAANPPVADTLFDHFHVIRQHNPWVRRGRYCQCSLHRSFSSVCCWRSHMAVTGISAK